MRIPFQHLHEVFGIEALVGYYGRVCYDANPKGLSNSVGLLHSVTKMELEMPGDDGFAALPQLTTILDLMPAVRERVSHHLNVVDPADIEIAWSVPVNKSWLDSEHPEACDFLCRLVVERRLGERPVQEWDTLRRHNLIFAEAILALEAPTS